MIVRELLTLLGFTVDKASYDKASKTYDQMTGRLTADAKAAQQAGGALGKMGQQAQQAAKGTGMLGQALGMFQRFSAQAGISGLLKEYVELASSADETQNVIKQIFGDQGLKEVTEWSQTMGEAMGRSQFSLQQYASQLGAVIQPIAKSDEQAQAMAQSLAALAVDLGSFFNTSDEDAMRALRSGLTGEYESLKRYGVVLNDTTLQEIAHAKGIKKKVTQMTAAEKTELRYEAILKRTERVEGDAIRTREGFANSSKAIKESLKDMGTVMAKTVLPKIEKLIGFTRDLLKWFNKVAKNSRILESALYTLAAVAGILALEFYGAFVLPALAVGALILLVDELWTTLEGGESVIRDVVDGLFGDGTTAKAVEKIQAGIAAIRKEFEGLDARAVWETFAAGADNAGWAVEQLIKKMIRLLKYTPPGLVYQVGKAAGQAAGLIGQDDAENDESFAEGLARRQRDQLAARTAGVQQRATAAAERARTEKYGPRQFSAVPTAAGPAVMGGEGYGVLAAPVGTPARGGAPSPVIVPVATAAPTIIINAGNEATITRTVNKVLDDRNKAAMAAVGRRGGS